MFDEPWSGVDADSRTDELRIDSVHDSCGQGAHGRLDTWLFIVLAVDAVFQAAEQAVACVVLAVVSHVLEGCKIMQSGSKYRACPLFKWLK